MSKLRPGATGAAHERLGRPRRQRWAGRLPGAKCLPVSTLLRPELWNAWVIAPQPIGSLRQTMLSDTHPDAERVQIDLLRRQSGAQRVAQLRSLTSLVIGLSRRAIARANPQLAHDETEIDMLWVEMNYGKQLADKLRAHVRNQ
jgi:hypothetical protein